MRIKTKILKLLPGSYAIQSMIYWMSPTEYAQYQIRIEGNESFIARDYKDIFGAEHVKLACTEAEVLEKVKDLIAIRTAKEIL
jgi:hypothetical protein